MNMNNVVLENAPMDLDNQNAGHNVLNNRQLGLPRRSINDVIFEMGIRNLHSYECFHNIAIRYNLTNEHTDVAYFHHLCAGATLREIEHWISNYINIHGYNNFVEFANRPLYNRRIGYNITPIVSAVLWNSVDVLRLLYSFGLRLDQVDGFYPEETILYYPFVHPIAHMFPEESLAVIFGRVNEAERFHFNSADNYRMLNDFRDMINEIRYISGEALPPANWNPVAPRYQ